MRKAYRGEQTWRQHIRLLGFQKCARCATFLHLAESDAQACAALCRPGGILCWMEAELPITNSPAFERLTSLVCEALQRVGQSFIPERMWEWAELFAARSGKTGVDRSSYKRHHLGITPMLGRWLRDAGCGAQRERPLYSIWGIDERVIHEAAYAIEASAEQPAHAGFVAQARRFAQ
jgi:hypothetical protein